MDEAQGGIEMAETNNNDLTSADDTTSMQEVKRK